MCFKHALHFIRRRVLFIFDCDFITPFVRKFPKTWTINTKFNDTGIRNFITAPEIDSPQ